MINAKKSTLILILKVLEEYSDSSHFLTQQDIIELVVKKYGILLERKAIANNIAMLNELGYEIKKIARKGYYISSRQFSKIDTSYLIDAIYSSKNISNAKANDLIASLMKTNSKYERNNYATIYKSNEVGEFSNTLNFNSIYLINEAIKRNRKIGFNYLTYDDEGNLIKRRNGFEYVVSPYYVINNYGKYFLLANYKGKNRPIQVFRLDYMKNLKIKDKLELVKLKDIDSNSKNFNVIKYLDEHNYVFGGDVIKAKFQLDNEASLSFFYDTFYKSFEIKKYRGKIYVEVLANEIALIYFTLVNSGHIKLVEPSELVAKIINRIDELKNKYSI